MSNLSGVSNSSSTDLANLLQSLSRSSQATSTSSASTGSTGATSPTDFLTSELEKQGYSGSKLSDIQSKIESAVKSLKDSSTGKLDPSKVHDAINNVLKSAGVNTNQIDADAKAQGFQGSGGPPPGGPTSGATGGSSSTSTDSTTNTNTSDDISALLESLGVDPKKFETALSSALNNANTNGATDFSKLFASAGSGSQVNVYA